MAETGEGIMAQRVSVPAVITAVVAALASIAAALGGVFTSGRDYGSLQNTLSTIYARVVVIESKVDDQRDRYEDLRTKQVLLEARQDQYERREGKQ